MKQESRESFPSIPLLFGPQQKITRTLNRFYFSELRNASQLAMGVLLHSAVMLISLIIISAYDPDDPHIKSLLLMNGTFEAFYPRGSRKDTGTARAAHSHGTFYKFRNPALVNAKNAAAYGYRFDGGRRFNYD